MNPSDWAWMQRALTLAEYGRGFVEPNPLVGAVIVSDNQIVGEGWHERFGEAHAEIIALARAGESARGGTLYVTLEPCCHFGKTPPCTEAILRAGIARVVAAMTDPFPQVAGRGAATLRAAGIAVEVGMGEGEARLLNAPYLKLLATARPYVHAKWAMSLDGKIATRTGDSQWISGEASRRWVHGLRGRMDAIVVGIGTVLADNPRLTARPPGARVAQRIILDRRGRLPKDSVLAQTARQIPVLIVSGESLKAERKAELQALGCEVLQLRSEDPPASVLAVLDELGRRRMTNVLVEGGALVLGSFLDARAIDEVHVFIAQRLIGGSEAKTPIAGMGMERLRDALDLTGCQVEQLESDVVIHGRLLN
jgi:diaminohydroxyphosphoribosylaminopyrimidine deaminase/5-amino-6-(5-phosphoribosylamino)uracil reductase